MDADRYGVMSYRHKVLDRETVIDGHYKEMSAALSYFDAARIAAVMNADPAHADQAAPIGLSDDPDDDALSSAFEPVKEMPPVNNLGSEQIPQYRTF